MIYRFGTLLLSAAVLSGASVAFANPVTYSVSTTASGSLGGVTFTDELVTLTASGNTANVTAGAQPPEADYYSIKLPVTLTVAGVGSGVFTDPDIEVVANNPFSDAGVGDFTTDAQIIFGKGPTFAAATLTSSFDATGPSAVNLYNSQFPQFTSYGTTDGLFYFTSAGETTFDSTVSPSATPEPSSLVLLGTGVLSLAGAARRRFRG